VGKITGWSNGSADKVAGATSGGESLRLVSGAKAPIFSLPNPEMATFDLAEASAQHLIVLHFYPRDVMPSSVRQAISFTDHDTDFAALDTTVVGVSLDDCLVHADFRDQHGIAMELLSDPEGEVCRMYGVWHERALDGTVRPTVLRSTFVIGSDGMLLSADYNVDVCGHTEKLLEQLNLISGRKNGNRQERRRHT
jgi:peroxiredoxin